MQLARVLGEVVSTVKDANLTGTTLLVLQPIAADGSRAGRTLVALDSVGAGVGEHVFFVRGREAAFPFYPAEPPTDATIVGIVDHWDVPAADRPPAAASRDPRAGRKIAPSKKGDG